MVEAEDLNALLADKAGQDRSIQSMDAFAAAMGDRFRDGMRLLDYGCGSGRFGAYMATRLSEFSYVGADMEDQIAKPEWCAARAPLAGDSRFRFMLLSDPGLALAVKGATDALLLSVLTHLPHGALFAVLQRLQPIAKHGGAIFASLYIGAELAVHGPKNYGPDGLPVYYRGVIYTESAIATACSALGLACGVVGHWTKWQEQTIYAFRRKGTVA